MLYREGYTYVLTDQHRTNGTSVNRQRVQGAHCFQPGDIVGIRRTLLPDIFLLFNVWSFLEERA